MIRSTSATLTLLLAAVFAIVPWGQRAEAQNAGYGSFSRFFLDTFALPIAGEDVESRRKREVQETYYNAWVAMQGMRKTDFETNVVRLRKIAATSRDAETRDLAKGLAAALPSRYVSGFVAKNDDGTLVRDPDPFIRHRLNVAGSSAKDGGDGRGN
jgi:hypothetical protein